MSAVIFSRILRLGLLASCLQLAATSAFARDYFVTPTGAGAQNGTSFANAYAKSKIAGLLNTTMAAGDTVKLGSGAYTSLTLNITSSGTVDKPKRLLGVDTGGGKPVISGSWVRTATESGTGWLIRFGANGRAASNWIIENIALTKAQHAINSAAITTGADHSRLTFRGIDFYEIRHAAYMLNVDDSVFENCTAKRYSKMGFRLELGCDRVRFQSCLADLSDGDATWWDHSELFPEGFIVNDGGAPNTDISFIDCIAKNHLKNGQVADEYWNGDGFDTEGNTVGLKFVRCISINNEDGGFDLKQAANSTLTMTDCVAIGNARNIRLWYGKCDLRNCVGTFPRKRGPSSSNGVGAIWVWDATVTADHFTGHGTNSKQVSEDRNGNATLTDSILSSTTGTGSLTSGTVTLGGGTVTFRPGAGTDPKYVNPLATWNGTGADMNNRLYGRAKGYSQPALAAGFSLKIDRRGADTFISFPTLNAKSYRLEFATEIASGNWTTLVDSIAGNGAVQQFTHANAAAQGGQFYRVVVLP